MQRSPGKQNRHLRVKLGPCCAMYWFCLSPTQNSPFRALSPTLGLLCVWERLTPKLQAGNERMAGLQSLAFSQEKTARTPNPQQPPGPGGSPL